MDLLLIIKAIIMGIVEGLTEFLPVSSTGHLIVAGRLLNFPEAISGTFEIFIQLGAILAVVVYFIRDLIDLLKRAVTENSARRLLLNIAIAFVPAAAVGFLFNRIIDEVLFNPTSVALALIAGGIIMLVVESRPRVPRTTEVEQTSLKQALGVGIAQIAALWPGMSRSASTLIGGMLMGLDRPTALRFSFYLSIPTITIASLFSLVRDPGSVGGEYLLVFATGLVVSFLVALVVIKFFLGYVARHDLKPFAWYRIGVGIILIVLAAAGFFA
jgi:undecaprenyl-diphosphatase